jgi:hypothetical protein
MASSQNGMFTKWQLPKYQVHKMALMKWQGDKITS